MILHPTDFSPCAQAALQVACALARQRSVPLIVLHVVPGSPSAAETKHRRLPELWQALREIRAEQQDVWIEPVLRRGRPATVIVETATETSCDLIVMGMQGAREAAPRVGAVAAHVVEHAACTVLCVRSPAEPDEQFDIAAPGSPLGDALQLGRFGIREAG
jgi:nucleotide-binding universal stress UspA family protein